ncbi:putative polyglutamine synthesis accessory protein MT0602 isoform X3 [Acropora palmata]|uniref:putative polyglutamine synthesis accessory protein MT0602 isoform X3 n=1 Tax=Acropora palmata TaxID=6131 RepID=UPI003DA00227
MGSSRSKSLLSDSTVHRNTSQHLEKMTANITVFMVGDVMLGRGIDMILEHSNHPILYERNGLDARDYVTLAERQNGSIPDRSERPVDYVWGAAIPVLKEKKPDLKMINLETSVTTSDTPWPIKGIHYRMHPKNVKVIQSAGIDCCVLANNHVADWGFPGLLETMDTLQIAGIKCAGVGRNSFEAQSPAAFHLHHNTRVLVFSAGHSSSGVCDSWEANPDREGVNMLEFYKPAEAVAQLREQIYKHKQDGDIIILSVHWGGNWGWKIDSSFVKFAHKAIDEAGVHVIHGHSSHHVKGIEVYNGRLIIYGCGDFLNDYEGITGHDNFRGDLALMYFVDINPATGLLEGLRMVPTQTIHLCVNKAKEDGIKWLMSTMSRECKKFGCDVRRVGDELHLVF